MRSVHYFQRFHGRENTHSANACLLLSRLYDYDNELFYNVLSSLFVIETEDLSTHFVLQERRNGRHSVPDFSIFQPSFKLVVEAKEAADRFNYQQLENHAEGLNSEQTRHKFLVLLAPSFGPNDSSSVEILKNRFKDISFLQVRYVDLYETIRDTLTDIRDDDMIAILEDYYDYCQEERLIDKSGETITVRLSGDTLEHNTKFSLYYDGNKSKWNGFSYIGLYNKKSVKFVGKIKSVYLVSGPGPAIERLDKGTILDEDRIKIEQSFQEKHGSYSNDSYIYYLVDKFSEVVNFKKVSLRGLYGKKKFYLSNYGLKDGASSDEVAAALSNKTWE